jgi:hypothetical protein
MKLCIHLGFMAEEISAKLKPDLKKADFSERAFLIITRDQVSNEYLFEQSFKQYVGLKGAIEKGQYDTTFQRTGCLIQSVRELTTKIEEHFGFSVENYRIGKESKLKDGEINLTIIKVGRPNVAITDIYFQAPEMGRETNLILKTVKGVLDAIILHMCASGQYYAKEKQVIIDVFGAGGSCHAALKPGSISLEPIKGVFSLRSRRKTKAYQASGALSFFGQQTDSEMVPRFKTEETVHPTEAQEILRFFYLSLANKKQTERGRAEAFELMLSPEYIKYFLKKDEDYRKIKEQYNEAKKNTASLSGVLEYKKELENFEEKELEKIRAQAEKYKPHEDFLGRFASAVERINSNSISLSGGIFLGAELKRAANILFGDKIGDANMEDDLVAKVEKHVKKTVCRYGNLIETTFFCHRVHCDPFDVDEIIRHVGDQCSDSDGSHEKRRKYLNAKITENTYTLEHYLDAILWGLSGFNPKYLAKNAHWNFVNENFQSLPNTDLEKWFYNTACSDNSKIVIDPFWREIATDFLSDTYKVAFGIVKMEPEKMVEFAEKSGKTIVAVKADTKNLKDGIENIRRLAEDIIDTEIEVDREGWKGELRVVLKSFLFAKNLHFAEDRYKVWVRAGKWENESEAEQTLCKLNFHYSPSNLDRALYVSTNIVALIDRAGERLTALSKLRVSDVVPASTLGAAANLYMSAPVTSQLLTPAPPVLASTATSLGSPLTAQGILHQRTKSKRQNETADDEHENKVQKDDKLRSGSSSPKLGVE